MIKIIVFCAIVTFTFAAIVPKDYVKLSPEASSQVKQSIAKCSTSKYSAADLEQRLVTRNYDDTSEFRDIVYCGYSAIPGLVKADGTLDSEFIFKMFSESDLAVVRDVIVKCNKNVGTTQDNTLHFFNCFRMNSPKLAILNE